MLLWLIHILWISFQILIGYNLILPVFFYLLYKIKIKKVPTSISNSFADYAIIVTAYEQTDSLPSVVNSILAGNSNQHYIIYIVADKCDISGLNFSDDRIVVLRPENTLESNTRSHFYAIQNFKRNHNRITIIDSDNLVAPGYLEALNQYFNKGFIAVQGLRLAKNLDTTYACLDAARDLYYHFFDGKVLFQIGSSATLCGSGMAFTTELYKECLEQSDISGAGFDKVLQYEIVKRNNFIAFTEDAIVYDEKTSRPDQLVNQRARWINTWFKYFKFSFKLIAQSISNRSKNQFLFGLVLLRPPLFIFILLSVICALVDLFISPVTSFVWALCFITFLIGFGIPIFNSKTDKRIISSLVSIPKFIFFQIISLLNVRKANKKSVATVHTFNSDIDSINSNQ